MGKPVVFFVQGGNEHANAAPVIVLGLLGKGLLGQPDCHDPTEVLGLVGMGIGDAKTVLDGLGDLLASGNVLPDADPGLHHLLAS